MDLHAEHLELLLIGSYPASQTIVHAVLSLLGSKSRGHVRQTPPGVGLNLSLSQGTHSPRNTSCPAGHAAGGRPEESLLAARQKALLVSSSEYKARDQALSNSESHLESQLRFAQLHISAALGLLPRGEHSAKQSVIHPFGGPSPPSSSFEYAIALKYASQISTDLNITSTSVLLPIPQLVGSVSLLSTA